jgi:hypothetical protein
MKDLSFRLSSEKANCQSTKCGESGKMFSLDEEGNDDFSLSKNNEDI